MWRRLALTVLLIGASALAAASPVAGQALCPRAYCVALPVVETPTLAHLVGSQRWFIWPFGGGYHLLYGQFANDSGAPLCDVTVAYTVDNPTLADERGSVTIPVIMPDEIEWRGLASNVEEGASLVATAGAWRTDGCAYVRLTPVEQRVTVVDFMTLRVEGSVRNDTAGTVRSPRVRLRPGEHYSHHSDLALPDVTLAPGATAAYSQSLSMYYHGGRVTSFEVTAIGLAP